MLAYTIHAEARLVVARVEGDVDAGDFRRFFDCLEADPRYEPTMDGLMDFRLAVAALGPEEIPALADYAVAKQFKRGRWAALVDQPRATALSMLYTKAVDARYPFQVFSTMQGISEFLGIDVSDFLQAQPTRQL